MISKVSEINYYFKYNKFKKIAVIAGENSFIKIKGNKILKLFFRKNEKIEIKCFFKKNKYPEINELKKIIEFLKSFKPDAIIAIGGGSVIDYAKIANIKDIEKNIFSKILNSSYFCKEKIAKLIAVPTTAGAGAEVTSSAVIYVNKKKYSIEDKLIIPDKFFLIPEVILNNNKRLKASAGFDAISQSIESIISMNSNKKSLFFAKKSLNLSLENYLNFLRKPNIYNSSEMSLAAMFSGKAINISKTTAPHAVSYPFTAHFNISHGHAVSLTLEKFLEFNYKNINHSRTNFNLNERYKMLFKLFGVKNIIELNKKIKNIKNQANLEDNFKILKIDINKNFNKIASGVNLKRLKNNPIEINKTDLKFILLNN